MRIIIAPQGFKGTLSGIEAASAIAQGVLRVIPDAEVVLRPVADGGHGTLETLLEATGGTSHQIAVMGPIQQTVVAKWGVLGNGKTAVVEMAEASGLTLVPLDRRQPTLATTYGTGQLIVAALEAGYRDLIIGVGGSATTDGGAGAMQALGIRLLDAKGQDIPFGPNGLSQLAHVDTSTLHPLARTSTIQIATDVSNPLCGPHGAATIYGPQKGATREQIPVMDAALSHFADIVQSDLGANVRNIPGSGAAGGLAFGLLSFLDAKSTWGIDLVCRIIQFDEILKGSDLLITGEGQLDGQTLSQKAPIGVAQRAKAQNIPVLAVAGSLGPGHEEVLKNGIDLVEPTRHESALPSDFADHTSSLVADAAERLIYRARSIGVWQKGID